MCIIIVRALIDNFTFQISMSAYLTIAIALTAVLTLLDRTNAPALLGTLMMDIHVEVRSLTSIDDYGSL